MEFKKHQKLILEKDTCCSSEANAILAKARQDIENEKKRAIVDLRNEIANLSIDIAERLIESELSDRNKADAIIKKELQDAHLN